MYSATESAGGGLPRGLRLGVVRKRKISSSAYLSGSRATLGGQEIPVTRGRPTPRLELVALEFGLHVGKSPEYFNFRVSGVKPWLVRIAPNGRCASPLL